jgi:hypothetical protein
MPGFVKGADMEMGFGRQWTAQAFTGQGRAAPGAKPPPGSARRGIELGDLAFADGIGAAFERDEDGNRRAAMLAAALTMTPIDTFRLTSRNKTDRTAQATTFESVGCATHNLILSSWLARCITFDSSASKPVGEVRRSRAGMYR